ncbi:ArgE/DapE family deacylase [Apilactobacillus quenuiae]|uniref:ArgE/DapE family deacylase n=1 Tax=Apilactobacillus quenuiae TaxID=2008377 RepID=UPI0021E80B94|nr:ArgE/DapE family deacylase [Apilactobacillus quenuiae]
MNKENKLKILSDLINIKTVDENEADVARYINQLLNHYGINSQIIEQENNRSNLVAEIGNGNGPKLAFEGHEDTVSEGNINVWDSNPFSAKVIGDKLFGRGATDMKSGLAAMIIAMIELKEQKVHLNGSLRLLATISEELTQGGAHKLTKLGYADDLDSMIIGEPTGDEVNNHSIVYSHKGALIYTVESIGKAAHSSTPELGIDAIDNLIEYRSLEKQLFASFTVSDDTLGRTIYTPDVFHGGKQVNSIPDFAYEKVMVRTIPSLPNDEIIDKLENLIDKLNMQENFNLKLKVNFSGQPVKSNPNARIVKLTKKIANNLIEEDTHFPLKAMSMGTDASQYTRNNDLDVIILGPGNNTAHQTNEFIDIGSYLQFINLYEEVAKKYLK